MPQLIATIVRYLASYRLSTVILLDSLALSISFLQVEKILQLSLLILTTVLSIIKLWKGKNFKKDS